MSSGGGGGSKVKYDQSNEQKKIIKALLPMLKRFGNYGRERYFGADAGPNMGAPSMEGVLTGQPMYDIPDPSMAMPTAQWYGSLSPEVKAGLYAPYEEAGEHLMNTMSSRGQLGSARGGLSGATGAAMGELAGNAAQNVGLNAWQMTAPAAMQNWQSQLNRNVNAYNAGQQERLGDFNTAMNVWDRPWQAMSFLGHGMPQGVVTPGAPSRWGGAVAGGMAGGMGAYQMSGGNPYWTGVGAIGGGLAGYL